MPDAQIRPTGTVPTPADYVVPDSAELLLKSVYAQFDGSGAGSPYLPLVRIISDAGLTVIEAVADTTIAAGASADVSWFPHVAAPAVAPSASVLATLMGTTNIGTDQTIPAGTTRAISFDTIATDSSGVFDASPGHGTTWHVNAPGTYQVLFAMSPEVNWPAAGTGTLAMNTNALLELVLEQSTAWDVDGGTDTAMFTGFAVAASGRGGILPARMRVNIRNNTATDVVTLGPQTVCTVNLLGPEVIV